MKMTADQIAGPGNAELFAVTLDQGARLRPAESPHSEIRRLNVDN